MKGVVRKERRQPQIFKKTIFPLSEACYRDILRAGRICDPWGKRNLSPNQPLTSSSFTVVNP
uniref:Uncharacterized protein n=1 Tax=Anguilla anguilla TaxID=7936 RepID=A0A0E9WF17_ANGAN